MKKLFTIICMLLPLTLWAQEPYAVLSEDNTVLTFYYDENKSSYTNTMGVGPFNTYTARGWHSVRADIHMVVFDSSFSAYSPTSTALWFWGLQSMTIISGIENLHTDEVTDMNGMFNYCYALESLDLSTFNTGKVTNIAGMFYGCNKLKTIYVADGWSTDKIITTTISGTGGNGGWQTFAQCSSLVGGKGTTFNAGHTDYTYAHIDGGANNPGYFTDKNALAVNDSIEIVGNTDLSSEWWTAFSSNYEIPANYTLHMRFVNHSAKANSWENWVMLCTADSTRMPEYFALRADRYGWGDYYDANGFSVNWADQDAFREAMDGATVDFTVRRWGSEVVVTSVSTATDGSEYKQTYTTAIDTAANRSVNVFLTVEKAYLEIYKNSITLTPSEAPAEPEPYAVLSDDNTVLTFYYDDQKYTHTGVLSMDPTGINVVWENFSENILSVVFDDSFSNFTSLKSVSRWFSNCKNLTSIVGIENLRTDNVTSMGSMFYMCSKLMNLDVSGFNTANVTSMSAMFFGCNSLTGIDVSGFSTANVSNMERMFYACRNLSDVDLRNFDTSKVHDMSSMFVGCSSLTSLDLNSFNTSNVIRMDGMFGSCSGLTTIYVGAGWDTSAVTSSNDMFFNCTSLVGGAGTVYDTNHIDHSYAHIDGGESNPGYFTDINAPVPAEKPSAPEFAFEGDNLVMTTQTDGASIFYAMADLPSTDDEALVDSVTNSFTVKVGVDNGNFYYEQPFELKKSVVLKAIAVGNGTDGQKAVSDTTVLVYDYETWTILIHTVAQAQDVYGRAEGNSKVDQTLVEELKWMIDECTMMYFQRAMMPYFEAKHFTARLVELMGEILGQMESQDNIIQFADARAKAICVANWDADSDGELSYDEAAAVQSIGEAFAQSKVATFNEFQYFKNVRQLSRNTFYMCDSLREVTLPDSLIAIGAYAFAKSPLLTTVSIPQTVMTIGESAFEGCTGLTGIVLPDSLEELGGWAIGDCTSLTSVVIPKKITSLSRRLLYRNTALTSVTLPETLLSIGESAFEGCTSLTAIDIPESVTEIGPNAFTGSGLEEVTIPANVTSIQERAFAGVESLTTVTSKIISPFEIRNDVFSEATYQNAVLYVPEGTVDAYRNTSSWNLFMRIRVEGSQGAPEPYAVLSEDSLTVTFYYDDLKASRGGMDINHKHIVSSDGEKNPYGTATTAVFDESFANYATYSTTYWFMECVELKEIRGIRNLNTANVIDMSWMFYGCSSLTSLDVSGFKTDNVTDMESMFYKCSSLTSIDVSDFNTSNVTDMWGMFADCSSLTSLDLSSFNTVNVTRMTGMFSGCTSLTSIDVSGFKTDNVTDMRGMFWACSSLTYLDISGFNTANVVSMGGMFHTCSSLTSLDLSSFNTANVTEMDDMFAGCSGLTSLDLSNFNTANVTRIHLMFNGCTNLQTIYAGDGWSTTAVIEGSNMFSGCTALIGGAGTAYDVNHADYTYAHIDGGVDNPGYFTDKNGTYNLELDAEGYYLLASVADWKKFAGYVLSVPTAKGRMTADIDLGEDQTMVGTEEVNYQGFFDGQGHTLNVNLVAGKNVAPFRYVNGATVEDLHVTGRMEANETCCVGGIMAIIGGSGATIRRCWSSSLLVSTTSGSKQNTIGGIASVTYGELKIEDCLFDGRFGDNNRWYNAGVIANNYGSIIIRNTLNVGTYPSNDTYYSGTFYRPDESTGTVSLENIYFKNACGTVQGTQVSDEQLMNGSVVTLLQNGRSENIWLQGTSYPILSFEEVDNIEPTFDFDTNGVLAVNSDVTMTEVLKEAATKHNVPKWITAIVWNSNKPIDNSELQELTNPNMLIYVAADSLAPQNRDNVIVGDRAKNIVLTDVAEGNGSFYCPQDFKAEMISYTRNFNQQTEVGVARGWETIALPFTVQTITHEKQGVIAPFNNTASNKHFWLRQVAESENDGGLTGATAIEAYTPYLISMPNSETYPADYCLNGHVTFSAQDALVGRTELYPKEIRTADGAMIMMVPCFQGQTATQDVYALNVGVGLQEYPEGSVFVRASRDVRPFEAFTVHHGGNAPQYIAILDLNGGAMTGIESLTPNPSPKGEGSNYYSLDGRKLQQKPNRKGVYIRNGKKMVVR